MQRANVLVRQGLFEDAQDDYKFIVRFFVLFLNMFFHLALFFKS